ncbi:DUF4290 domain-containing protein [Olivibacter sp. SDN3]|uniref:DUF4290 domain-containing protein n=1 Tax=Olivibacter sp. SDN3 TaxID=2764720 RepID=UPI001651994F|nr:DUF4290 domain-containing protein [Olivibacter sp. SDN3]QNL49161.1 DUF4290 domain-containing protein [Olivibacter sp. SDN3]
MEFDYNSTRKKLILAEYGRNVQNMVAYICTLPTREERNRHAQVVIDLMGFLNPHLRDVSDFKHKLWDHLHIISDFKIDVDSPYPVPIPGAIHAKPETLNYPQHRIKYKHYGHTIELMIEKAKKIEDPERKKQMVQAMANFMKMAYVTWNKDSVTDDHIIHDLKEMSEGILELDEDINLTKLEFKTPPPGNRTKGGSNTNQQGGNGGGQKNRQQHKNQNNNGKKRGKRF